MAWLYHIIAAIFEVGWPLGFKLSGLHPERFWTYISLASISILLSGVFLYFAQKEIPVSTAYIIWTGIGAVGTFLLGICCFGNSASVMRMFTSSRAQMPRRLTSALSTTSASINR